MSRWRGICWAIILIAPIGVALGASALQHQTLEIPWTALDPTTQQRLRDVTEHAILFRELHGIVVRSHRPVFEFLIEHPDFAATAGRVLGIIRDRIVKEREGRYWGDDNHGATGTFELVYAAPGQRVYLSEGTFVKRLFPTIYGRIVLVMAYEYQTDQAGESLVVNHIRGYLRIDNPILGVLARIAKPVVGPNVDKKVRRTFANASKLTERASGDPATLYRSLATSNQVNQSDLREFRKVLPCCVDGRRASRSAGGWDDPEQRNIVDTAWPPHVGS